LEGNGELLGIALVGTYGDAEHGTALSFADESYQVLGLTLVTAERHITY
jgi:hypothetical protein